MVGIIIDYAGDFRSLDWYAFDRPPSMMKLPSRLWGDSPLDPVLTGMAVDNMGNPISGSQTPQDPVTRVSSLTLSR